MDPAWECSGSILLGFLCTFCPIVVLPFGLVRIVWYFASILPSFFFAGMGKKDDPKLMQEWFKLVQEKNALVRYESELMIL